MIRLDVEGGKYTIVLSDRGCLSVLRGGERWIDDVGPGSKMWIAVVHELDELRRVKAAAVRAVEILDNSIDGDDAVVARETLRNALDDCSDQQPPSAPARG